MLLIYVDDSGNTWELTEKGIFKDGPFVIHSGIFVNEQKYFHLERMFYDLFSSILKVSDWRKNELHASNIWHREGVFENLTDRTVRKYFAEFMQMLAKFSIEVVVGIQQKRLTKSVKLQREDIKYSQYAFLHCVEHVLSQFNQTGVIISDAGDKIESLSGLLYARSRWRYNPGADKRKQRLLPGYKYETLSCFILDQMHFVSSKDSFFIQIADHISFIIQRVLTYSYLKNYPKEGVVASIEDVPVSQKDFRFYTKNIQLAEYKKDIHDVSFSPLSEIIKTQGLDQDELVPRIWVSGITPYK